MTKKAFAHYTDSIDKLIDSFCQIYQTEIFIIDSDSKKRESYFTYDTINKHIKLIQEMMTQQQKSHKLKTKKRFYIESKILDMLMVESLNLNLIFIEKLSNMQKDDSIIKEKEQQIFFNRLSGLINLLNDNLYAMKHLISIGLVHQTYLILRNYIELGFIILATLASNSFAKDYFESEDDNDPKKALESWYKYYKPEKVDKLLNEIYTEMNMHDRWLAIKRIKDHCHSVSSQHTHGRFLTSFFETYYIDSDNEGNFRLKAFGGVTNSTKAVFSNVTLSVRMILYDISIFLVYHKKLPMKKFGHDGLFHTFILKVNEELFSTYIEMLPQDEEE